MLALQAFFDSLRAGHARPLPRNFFKLPLQAFQMPLRQTVHFLGACKAKGADGLFLGGDDRHDSAFGQRTASAVRVTIPLWLLFPGKAPAGPF